jgi:hypothetical protein
MLTMDDDDDDDNDSIQFSSIQFIPMLYYLCAEPAAPRTITDTA